MSIAALCVQRPVFAAMLISFLMVLGIFSFRDLGVDLFPRTDPATVTINVQLPGASAEEVSTQVILPLEEAVSSVSGLDELTSEASEGNARITCKFDGAIPKRRAGCTESFGGDQIASNQHSSADHRKGRSRFRPVLSADLGGEICAKPQVAERGARPGDGKWRGKWR
jgi:hypothetical protein